VESKHTLAEYHRGYYHERKRLGLCVQSCGRKAEPGRTRCDVCLRKNREQKMVQHPLFCDECERPIKFAERSGRRLHKLCAQKRKARMSPRTHRLAALAYRRRHKEMGFCLNCPKKLFKAGLCRRHYQMTKKRIDRAAGRI